MFLHRYLPHFCRVKIRKFPRFVSISNSLPIYYIYIYIFLIRINSNKSFARRSFARIEERRRWKSEWTIEERDFQRGWKRKQEFSTIPRINPILWWQYRERKERLKRKWRRGRGEICKSWNVSGGKSAGRRVFCRDTWNFFFFRETRNEIFRRPATIQPTVSIIGFWRPFLKISRKPSRCRFCLQPSLLLDSARTLRHFSTVPEH